MLSTEHRSLVAVVSPLDMGFASALRALAESEGLTCRVIDSDAPGQDVFDTDFLSSFLASADVVVCNTLTEKGSKDSFWQWNVGATRAVCVAAALVGVKNFVMIASPKIGEGFKADNDSSTLLRSLFRGEMEAADAAELGLNVSFVRSLDPNAVLSAFYPNPKTENI